MRRMSEARLPLVRCSKFGRVPPQSLEWRHNSDKPALVVAPKSYAAAVLLGAYSLLSGAVLCREAVISDCNFFHFRPARWLYATSPLLVVLSVLIWVREPRDSAAEPRGLSNCLSSALAVGLAALCSVCSPGLFDTDQVGWTETGVADVAVVCALCFASCLEGTSRFPVIAAVTVLCASTVTRIPEAYNSLPRPVALAYSIGAAAEAAVPFIFFATTARLGVPATGTSALGTLCSLLGFCFVAKTETCIALSCRLGS